MEERYAPSKRRSLLNMNKKDQILDISNVELTNSLANSPSPRGNEGSEARILDFPLTSSEPCDWQEFSKHDSPLILTDISVTTSKVHKNARAIGADLILSKQGVDLVYQLEETSGASPLPTSCSTQPIPSNVGQYRFERPIHVMPDHLSSNAGTALDTIDQKLYLQQRNPEKTIKIASSTEYKHNQNKFAETLGHSPYSECNESDKNMNPRETSFLMTLDIGEIEKLKDPNSPVLTLPELDSDWSFSSNDLEFECPAGLGIEVEGIPCDFMDIRIPDEQNKADIQLSKKLILSALPAPACVRPESPLSVDTEDLTFFESLKRAQEDPLLPSKKSCTTENLSIDPRMLSRSSNSQSISLQPGKRKQSSSLLSQRNATTPKTLSSDLKRYRYTWSDRDTLGLETMTNKVTFVYDESTAQALQNNSIVSAKGQSVGKHVFVVTDWSEGNKLYG